MKPHYKLVIVAIATLWLITVMVLAYVTKLYVALNLDIGAAREEIKMVEYARASYDRSDPSEAAALLSQLRGSFQSLGPPDRGSGLGDVVEVYKDSVERELIESLREATRRELGDDPAVWIETYMKNKKPEQGGSGQPATRPESKSEGGDKPQPESEGRSR